MLSFSRLSEAPHTNSRSRPLPRPSDFIIRTYPTDAHCIFYAAGATPLLSQNKEKLPVPEVCIIFKSVHKMTTQHRFHLLCTG